MDKVISFFKEAYDELLHKVTWPKYADLQNSSILVLVASLIFALMIGLFDFGFENAMKWFYNEF
ncbi:MAG: preprotein translocase subunit SecE [Marinoscillum sp.]|mgnify:FL=1|jgi:preprotein translocase subunit SecE|uniref:Protein translocase subunit SecE n=1 Tax=Marinoscillum luteum TaxID=861051 RepID=A0ABW7N8Y0_9BACT|nr:preprotein translocase subunit SecE [Marinoscillum sp. 108]VXD17140.1 Protein translocase subunit SecE [Marinoscillum sp. 108]